jgi:alpha(1,3/1,4) fucosyltransferase
MKPRIRLGFSDFWPGFDPRKNFFTRLLNEHYELEISEQPDFLIYSCFGQQFRRHNGIRIFYTGENLRPNLDDCDFAFSFDYLNDPKHMRLPYWFLRHLAFPLGTKQNFDTRAVLAEKTRFCNFVYSNKYCVIRNRLFRKLSKYKQVDAAGRLFNNIGGRLGPGGFKKLDFIRPYKFTIAFENESHPGYTTEKVYEAMLVDTLPIYWGDPLVGVDFNSKSFLSYYDHGSLEALIERLIEVDRDEELYCEYLSQPWRPPQLCEEATDHSKLLARFEQIFSASQTPVARQKRSVRYFIIHPPRRAAATLKLKSARLATKIRYHLSLG